MALEEYQRKRDFRKTPEPSGRLAPARKPANALSFVVQKHAARRLHYDFRLEVNGVLLSWAIPTGHYGGGTVLLWDRGSWVPEGPDPEAAYRKGALKFRLDGDKLHGHWALVRMGG